MNGLKLAYKDIPAGILTGLLITLLSISYSTLIFNQDLASYLPVGIGLSITTTILLSLFSILMSSLPMSVSMTQDAPTIIYGLIASHIILTVKNPALAFDLSIVIFITYTVIIGLTLFILGKLQISRIIKYIPYSVIGGFLAGTGALIVYGGLSSTYGGNITADKLGDFFSFVKMTHWLPGLVLGTMLLFLERLTKRPALIPITFLGICILFYLGLYFFHISFLSAQKMGLLLGPFTGKILWKPPSLAMFSYFSWHEIFSNLGYLLSLMILVPIAMLLNVTGIETKAKENIDLNQELKHTGLANIISCFTGGGLIGYASLSGSILNVQLNAKTRLSSILCVLICLLVLILGTDILNYVPKLALGALVSYVGLNLIYDWLVEKHKSLPIIDYLIILTIFLIICFESFLTGVVVGLIIHLAIFVYRYSRIDAIANTFDGSEIRSNVQRSLNTLNFLDSHGDEIYVIMLKGYLFFGNIDVIENVIFERVKTSKDKLRHIVLDFTKVVGIDHTSLINLEKLRIFLEENNIQLACSIVRKKVKNKLTTVFDFTPDNDTQFYCFENLDLCLEWCETQQMIKHNYPLHETKDINKVMQDVLLKNSGEIKQLSNYFTPVTLKSGEVLFKQGETCSDLYFVESGCLAVYLESEGKDLVVSKIMAGAFVGVFAFILEQERLSSVMATEDSHLQCLSQENIDLMIEKNPQLAVALLKLLTANLSQALIEANHSIQKFINQ